MRPEVCCLVGKLTFHFSTSSSVRRDDTYRPCLSLTGNYYSLRRDHEKAIVYFRRALKLDRGYLSAWTLMGHEYIEIKNTNAAIASYRRAVGEQPRFLLDRSEPETDHLVSLRRM